MILIQNGHLITMDENKPFMFKGNLLIDNHGKIKAVGENIDPPKETEVKIIDATDKIVMPGMIDIHTHLGLYEEGLSFEGDDINEETDPITAELRAIDGINPRDKGLEEARTNGITSTVVSPGSANPIAGQAVAIKTWGRIIDQMVIKEPASLKVAFGENPKSLYHGKDKSPMTRMATAALIRKSFVEAENYLKEMTKDDDKDKKDDKDDDDKDDGKERDLQKEIIAMAINRDVPVKAHAHRSDDILTAIRIAKEFKLDLILNHCTEGHIIADILKEYQYPIILGPTLTSRSKVELKELSFETPKVLASHDISFAITTDHPVIPIYALPICAGLAVREGLDREKAFGAITIDAAKIARIDDRVGSLEEDKDGDIVIFSGDPLSLDTKPEHVFISGEKIL
ncbi:amidohydrolase [Natranaerofaba carboxydovora]|uniref:amidohydrolase n=1 Tax=Natranaerofaba carboxydovora TaxID=2742683 RepID=UPI001F13796B|nr:amidohydrolase [Natranaerofaba carboxydovora]UMZ75012.1 Amidohydrolase family protein [Natranaerofaba carboxydovora]